jgi:Domain of unknown function (DUF932)
MTRIYSTPSTAILSRDDLRRLAPAAFASAPHDSTSGRYRMVPTIEVVDLLADRGFHPVRASQGGANTNERLHVARHLIRFRHADYLSGGRLAVGDEFPELILSNAHDGSAAYRFSSGIFRLVCANGMVVAS